MDTRTHLLDCAEAAARQRGYDAFSYADLAREVGIRKASIHYHFPLKADLALALIERYAERFFAALDDIAHRQVSPADQLRAYHAIYRSALANGTQLCLCVAMSSGRSSLPDPVLDRLNHFHADSVTWLAAIFGTGLRDGSLPSGIDPDREAMAALALMEGAQLIARAAEDLTLFDSATAGFLSRLNPQKISRSSI